MKGLRFLLAVCLAPLAFGGVMAADNTDAARAAVRRTTNNSTGTTQPKSSAKSMTGNNRTTASTRSDAKAAQNSQRSPSGTNRTQSAPSVHQRTTTQPVTTRTTPAISVRPSAIQRKQTTTRTASTDRTATTQPKQVTTPHTISTATTRAALSRTSATNIHRAADTTANSARTQLLSNNAKKCREVYYNCMDEFCANKDAVLKRCACSTRIHEFDNTKKNLADIEDKMLTFNQRLLTVNMDKEDAEALYKATEGELAFNQKDTSQSKKTLDEIAKKLNTSFDDSNFDRNLSPISLSLNIDAAFDNIDSLQGAATTSKSGTDLYTAALPVCREMAQEVCTSDELSIAESGYQMVIEQDCNTVAKSYQTQVDQARERVREGGALLDMSRLDIHQKRNSDDVLTCKKKMLDMLTDSSVCGSGLGKCLDVSGKYIDPSTGEAFLTNQLVQLNNLITRPTGDQKWSSVPANNTFVSYLNTKKKFLEPATENCQDIANTVWKEFLDDALAQIKLAQEEKLENMRQSCTSITTKCLTDTAKSLSDFDARALSVFGIKADKTVTAMCSDIKTACSALLQDTTGTATDNTWETGMTEIANTNTYETILQTCSEIGRNCIIQICSSSDGNFGLCKNIETSINRKSIINRTACWDQVYNCVADAGKDKISAIMKQLGKTTNNIDQDNFYAEIYNINTDTSNTFTLNTLDILNNNFCRVTTQNNQCTKNQNNNSTTNIFRIYDLCDAECKSDSGTFECQTCRITEQIWGNCESDPLKLIGDGDTNKILEPKSDKSTLLWWFAQNTNTDKTSDSCRDTSCGAGYQLVWTEDNNNERIWSCALDGYSINNQICKGNISYQVTDTVPNCCPVKSEDRDSFGNCYQTSVSASNPYSSTSLFTQKQLSSFGPGKLYIPDVSTVIARWSLDSPQDKYPAGEYTLICAGASPTNPNTEEEGFPYPFGKEIDCSEGTYVIIHKSGLYFTPSQPNKITNYVEAVDIKGTRCNYSQELSKWVEDNSNKECNITPQKWTVDITY